VLPESIKFQKLPNIDLAGQKARVDKQREDTLLSSEQAQEAIRLEVYRFSPLIAAKILNRRRSDGNRIARLSGRIGSEKNPSSQALNLI
jgi:hypothetical protein